jgi:hypothetical protein
VLQLLGPWAEPQPASHGVALLLPGCCERLHRKRATPKTAPISDNVMLSGRIAD